MNTHTLRAAEWNKPDKETGLEIFLKQRQQWLCKRIVREVLIFLGG
jgi:hypothetical protein